MNYPVNGIAPQTAMATPSSSTLLNLYPRESDELTSLLHQHNVSMGKPKDIFGFPERLLASSSLQKALGGFVQKSRSNPRGPVSLNAMLHLVLTTIGGPGAADLGPEADEPTSLITSFLADTGHWPELAFAEPDDTPMPVSSHHEQHPPERRIRSLAASLAASQAGNESSFWTGSDSTPLAEIAQTLARLEQSQVETAQRLDALSERLHRMERSDVSAAPVETPAYLPEKPGRESWPSPAKEPDQPLLLHPRQATDQNAPVAHTAAALAIEFVRATPFTDGGVQAAGRLEPLQAERPSQNTSSQGPSVVAASNNPPTHDSSTTGKGTTGETQPGPTAAPPSHARELVAGLQQPQAAVQATVRPAEFPTPTTADPDDQKPTPDWEKLFTSPEKSRRSPAPLPFAIVAIILVLLAIAVIAYLRGRAEPPSTSQEVVPAAAPLSSSQQAAATSDETSTQEQPPSPRLHSAASPPGGQDDSSSSTRTVNRVLGARERYQPKQSAESLEPGQPPFVSASAMEDRLIYAPQPQHPRVAGVIGLSGMVVMELTVSAKGNVENVRVLGGHHLLRDAAVNAVHAWRYRPVVHDGRPIAVRTTVRLDFSPQEHTAANH